MTGSSSGFFCCLGALLCFSLLGSALGLPQQSSIKSSYKSNGIRVDDTLKFVGIVASHGNVAPCFDYSGNPYPVSNTNYWPFGAGELTKVGRNKLYSLGQRVRSLYDGFLDAEYSDSDFKASSPEVDRTTMSAQLFTAGLYPPVDYEVWNTDLLWQPILMDVDDSDKTLDITSCARFLQESTKSVDEFNSKFAANISDVSEYLSKSTGTNVAGAQGIASVWEMIYSQRNEQLNKLNSSWATGEHYRQIRNLTGQYYLEYFAGSDEAVKLVIGTLFEEIITSMQNFDKSSSELSKYQQSFHSQVEDGPGPDPTGGSFTGGPGPGPMPTGGPGPGPMPTGGPGPGPSPFSSNAKMVFYSAYNASLITLQAVLGISSYDIVSPVNPGSAMVFELHENATSNEYYVQVLWVDGDLATESLEPKMIPNCGTTCDFTTFVSLTEKFYNMSSYNSECQTSSHELLDVTL